MFTEPIPNSWTYTCWPPETALKSASLKLQMSEVFAFVLQLVMLVILSVMVGLIPLCGQDAAPVARIL